MNLSEIKNSSTQDPYYNQDPYFLVRSSEGEEMKKSQSRVSEVAGQHLEKNLEYYGFNAKIPPIKESKKWEWYTFVFADGSSYEGNIREGLRHGIGTSIDTNGSCYEGDWENDKLHGKGKCSINAGSVFDILFATWSSLDKIEFGKQLNIDPRQTYLEYEGDFKEGKMHGYGKQICLDEGPSSNVFYEGSWKDNRMHGYGILKQANGSSYKGDWQEDKRHGYGKSNNLTTATHTKDIGKMTKMHGQGTLIFADGSSCKGEWQEDRPHGYGIIKEADGSSYEGDWIDGKRQGVGTIILADGSSYEGNWENGKMHGEGKHIRADGSWFKGEWKDGELHEIEFKLADGSSFKGGWKDDKRHGHGLQRYANGDSYHGEWKDDKKHGKGILVTNETTYYGTWENGNELKLIDRRSNDREAIKEWMMTNLERDVLKTIRKSRQQDRGSYTPRQAINTNRPHKRSSSTCIIG